MRKGPGKKSIPSEVDTPGSADHASWEAGKRAEKSRAAAKMTTAQTTPGKRKGRPRGSAQRCASPRRRGQKSPTQTSHFRGKTMSGRKTRTPQRFSPPVQSTPKEKGRRQPTVPVSPGRNTPSKRARGPGRLVVSPGIRRGPGHERKAWRYHRRGKERQEEEESSPSEDASSKSESSSNEIGDN